MLKELPKGNQQILEPGTKRPKGSQHFPIEQPTIIRLKAFLFNPQKDGEDNRKISGTPEHPHLDFFGALLLRVARVSDKDDVPARQGDNLPIASLLERAAQL